MEGQACFDILCIERALRGLALEPGACTPRLGSFLIDCPAPLDAAPAA